LRVFATKLGKLDKTRAFEAANLPPDLSKIPLPARERLGEGSSDSASIQHPAPRSFPSHSWGGQGSQGRGELRDEFILLLPPIVIFTVVSSKTGFNEHMRRPCPAFHSCSSGWRFSFPDFSWQRRMLDRCSLRGVNSSRPIGFSLRSVHNVTCSGSTSLVNRP
jgi:hypothetical protein